MHIRIALQSSLIDADLRQVIEERVGSWLQRFQSRLQQTSVVLRAEHGKHGAPRYRCRLEADCVDGRRLQSTADHPHPQGAVAEAVEGLRRRLAEQASGLPIRMRRLARRRRQKGLRHVA